MPLSWRLSGGARLRSGPGSTLGQACWPTPCPAGTRSGSENLTLAIPSPHSIPCRHGNTACITTRGVGTDPTQAQASIRALEARVEALETMVQALQEHNRALQEQLSQTSRNSSRPPSSDPPQHARPRRPRSKRRRGGQPGHPGHTRTLIPVEEVDEVVVLKPGAVYALPRTLRGR